MSDSDHSVPLEDYFVRVASTRFIAWDELKWCRAEGVEYNRPALVAFWILHEHSNWDLHHIYSGSLLPDRSDSEGWNEILQWRLPRVDLNLLQLAALCDAQIWVEDLQNTVLAGEENYRDENSRLMNHPVHLACRLGCHSALRGMTAIPPKVLCEGGAVDFTAARVNRSPSKEGRGELNTDDGSTSGASADSVDLPSVSSDNELLALLKRNDAKRLDSARTAAAGEIQVTGTPLALIVKGDSPCVPILLELLAKQLLRDRPHPQQVAVDSLRNTLREVCRSGMSAQSFNSFVRSFTLTVARRVRALHYRESKPSHLIGDTNMHARLLHKAREEVMWCREMLILVCQLLWCLPKEEVSSMSSFEAVRTIFRSLIYDSASQSYQKAANYLPQKHLSHMIEAFHQDALTRQQQRQRKCSPIETAVQVLKEAARDRRLQDLCKLPILQSVRGDARAARNLSALPEPLRKRFHVPFQDLYDQLYSGTQASNRT